MGRVAAAPQAEDGPEPRAFSRFSRAFVGWFDRQTPGAISAWLVQKVRRIAWSNHAL
jgi:hypothetical protein